MIDWLTLIALIGGILIVEGRYRQLHGRIKRLERKQDNPADPAQADHLDRIAKLL